MTRKSIAFVTAEGWRGLDADDHPAVAALNERGHIVDAAIWDDPSIDWTTYNAIILRSCWDYYTKPQPFKAWIDDLERRDVPLFNPAPTLRWNLDKIYLRDLERAGVLITPTAFPEPGERLGDIARERGWSDVVLKPRVSAAGHRTVRSAADALDVHQGELDDLTALGGALVQQYLPVIEQEGEWSFVFMGGEFSHAVRKRPAAGEFRVQVQYGGSVEAADPGPDLIRQAGTIMDNVGYPWLYARVDGCAIEGRLHLMELELLEPSLFLRQSPAAAARFAAAIEACLR